MRSWKSKLHSYSLVAQQHALEMLKRDDVEFRWRGEAMPAPFTDIPGIFSAEDEKKIAQIPPPVIGTEAWTPDLSYRIAWPPKGDADFNFVTFEAGADGNDLSEVPGTIITPSNWSKTGLIQHGIAPERIRIVPHAYNAAYHASPDDERTATRLGLHVNDDQFVFLHVSSLLEIKGLKNLLMAFAILATARDDVVLLLKGIDAIYTSVVLLRRMLTELELPERVVRRLRYIGNTLSNDQMRMLYGAADACVFPYQADAFCLPALEALACERPTIITQGGPTDAFVDIAYPYKVEAKLYDGKKRRYLVPAHDSLIDRMHRVVEERGQGVAKIEYWRAQDFTWKSANDKLVKVLTEGRV